MLNANQVHAIAALVSPLQAAYEVPQAPDWLLNTTGTNVANDVAQLLALMQPQKP